MKRFAIAAAALLGVAIACPLAHIALIEIGREVIVLRTERADGSWLESRLWIVDYEHRPWLHGADSRWMANLRARPLVELDRGGETQRYTAQPVPGPHPEIDRLFREKYGVADRWVRFIVPDDESTMPVRLDPRGDGPT